MARRSPRCSHRAPAAGGVVVALLLAGLLRAGPAGATGSGCMTWPFPTKSPRQYSRVDQGWDLGATSGTVVRAVAAGVVGTASPNPGGFGNDYPYVVLDRPITGAPSDTMYYGHVHVRPAVVGRHVNAGDVIAVTSTYRGQGGSPTSPGWLEIGFARHAMGAPAVRGRYPTWAGTLMKNLLLPLTPAITCSHAGHDLDGDRRSDALVRLADGRLQLLHGTGSAAGPLVPGATVPGNWNGFSAFVDGDLDRDGRSDVLARIASTGEMRLFRGRSSTTSPLAPGTTLRGNGWNAYDAFVGGDFDGDGFSDVIARRPAGTLRFFRGTGAVTAPFAPGIDFGSGWQTATAVVAADVNADGRTDVVARRASGTTLHLGVASARVPLGAGAPLPTGPWSTATGFLTGDFTGDGRDDLIARRPDGTVQVLPGTGSATAPFRSGPVLRVPWATFTAAA